MTQDELEAKLITSKSYSEAFHNTRRQRDAKLMETVKQGKAAIKVNSPIKVDDSSNGNTTKVHSTFTTASTGVSTECSL